MKKEMLAVFLLMLVGFASAVSLNITIIDEAGSCSGAVLRLKASENGELGDKIYPNPDKYLKDAGILKFEVDTSLAEIFFNVVFTKDGAKVKEIDKGPFDVNGSDIVVDLREIEELEVIKTVEVEENVSEDLNETNESIVEVEVGAEDLNESEDLVEITGRVMQSLGDYGSVVYYSVGGALLVILVLIIIFVSLKRSGKKKKEKEDDLVDEDEKELKVMEKKMKETEAKIGQLKELEKKKTKLAAARKKLKEEEEELKRLEKGGDEKKVAQERKEIKATEEKIEDIDSF